MYVVHKYTFRQNSHTHKVNKNKKIFWRTSNSILPKNNHIISTGSYIIALNSLAVISRPLLYNGTTTSS